MVCLFENKHPSSSVVYENAAKRLVSIGRLQKYFESYLSGRKPHAEVHSLFSFLFFFLIQNCVLQGSMLGPVSLTIYINNVL